MSDAWVPEDGSPYAFTAVVPEGALGAFLGEAPAGDWTLEVVDDGYGNDATIESWTLRLEVVGQCGNGVVDAGEQCDDGNGGNGDGCDADCRPSRCGNGLVGIDEECDDGNTDDGDGCRSNCTFCGDGVVDDPFEGCDDGNTDDGDGCSAVCLPEAPTLAQWARIALALLLIGAGCWALRRRVARAP